MFRGIKKEWLKIIKDEAKKEYFKNLQDFLFNERQAQKEIFPIERDTLNAFKITDIREIKVIVIGQDPYHGVDQAHGLSFSVKKGQKVPPSLKNIYKEIEADLGIAPPDHGDLTAWAEQGVLLLNSVFTVEKSTPGSHRKKGWETFSDRIIDELNINSNGLVFILWGNDAKKKGEKIDRTKHMVLESAHPSPFSVTKFRGNKHFSKTNTYLDCSGKQQINWDLK
jgi:uracil-DNA glycosylase